jgi:hypothetical protein
MEDLFFQPQFAGIFFINSCMILQEKLTIKSTILMAVTTVPGGADVQGEPAG